MQQASYQAMEVMEALEQINALVLVPWKPVGVGQSFFANVVGGQCHHARVAAELLPQLSDSGQILCRILGVWVYLDGECALETGCRSSSSVTTGLGRN